MRTATHLPLLFVALSGQSAVASEVSVFGTQADSSFGASVAVLDNGNILVLEPGFDCLGRTDCGAIRMYTPSGTFVNAVFGQAENDRLGAGGIVKLSNGHAVVTSPAFLDGRGAATWIHASSGGATTLAGSSAGDGAEMRVVPLANGDYAVAMPKFDNGSIVDAGAVIHASGSGGTGGQVNAANALVGSTSGDEVGRGVTPLPNGAFVVGSFRWDRGILNDAGAATFCSPSVQCVGQISELNSLVGGSARDRIGSQMYVLANGNYLAASRFWDSATASEVGAVTWGDGTVGSSGTVSAANSYVGASAGDAVGGFVALLANGNYVLVSRSWDSPAVPDVGAVTWVSGASATSGVVGLANSLVGRRPGDLSAGRAVPLANGHYAISAPYWDASAQETDFGAVLWADGTTPLIGLLDGSGSLVGARDGDRVGLEIVALPDGKYVVASPEVDFDGNEDVGAVTLRSGLAVDPGVVSGANSLVGSTANDRVGDGVYALADSDYVVLSRFWSSATVPVRGAVTLCAQAPSCVGAVDASNSELAQSPGDLVASSIVPLDDGNYVIAAPAFGSNGVEQVGAAAWRDGSQATGSSELDETNSLHGVRVDDVVGRRIEPLAGGRHLIVSRLRDGLNVADSGVISLAYRTLPQGTIDGAEASFRSVYGSAPGAGPLMSYDYNAQWRILAVGNPLQGIVTILSPSEPTETFIDLVAPAIVDRPMIVRGYVESLSTQALGTVSVTATSGETCSAQTRTTSSSTRVDFECALVFHGSGDRKISAAFLATEDHGFSRTPEVDVSVNGPPALLSDSFE